MQSQVSQGPLVEQKRDFTGQAGRALYLAAVVAIILAAAYLRLWGLEYSFTGGDQAAQLNIALRWVTRGQFPLAGHKYSVGLMSPPLTEYMLAMPLFLRRDLVWVAQFVAALDVASVALAYLIMRNVFGRQTALLATLLYAVNPWAVHYARLTLNLSFIPFFSTLLLGSLLVAFTGKTQDAARQTGESFAGRRSALHLALIFLWVSAAIQLYTPSLAVVLVVGLLLWIFRKRLTLRPLLIGVSLFVLSFVPFLIYEIETGFMDLYDFQQATHGTVQTNLASVAIGLELVRAQGVWHTMRSAWHQWRTAAAWGEGLGALVPWLFLAGLIVAGWRLLRRRDEFRTKLAPSTVGLIVTIVLLTVSLLFYVRHSTYLQNYYFMHLYPILFIIMALPAEAALTAVRALPPTRRRFLWPLAWLPTVLLVALAGWQFYIDHVGLQLRAQGASGERQIRHVQQAIDTFADWSDRHPDCDLFIASDGYEPIGSMLGEVGEFLAPQPVRYVRLGSGTIIPRSCGLYLVASDDPAVRAWYDRYAARLPELTIGLPNDAWHFYELTPSAHGALAQALRASPALGQWDNGVQLRSYEVTGDDRPGQSLGLSLVWEVYDTPPKQRYHFFNHLLDQNGTLVAQADGPGVFSRYWQPGEFFVTWFDIAVPADAPPGPYRLLLGLYDWPSLVRPHLSDGRDGLLLSYAE
jgi:4-amino-4-deoxy-L-arabinose transferase-like glycosyltransferase